MASKIQKEVEEVAVVDEEEEFDPETFNDLDSADLFE